MLGAKVRVCAPRTLLPAAISTWPVEVFSDVGRACEGVDAVICLRLQLERQQAGLLPDLRAYAGTWGLGSGHLKNAAEDVRVMHPGPMNRGLEIASDLADCGASLILDQVASGVAVRMALLHLYLTRSRVSAYVTDEKIKIRRPLQKGLRSDNQGHQAWHTLN